MAVGSSSEPQAKKRRLKIAIIGAGGIGQKLWEDIALYHDGDIGMISLWNRSNIKDNKFKAKELSIDQRAIAAGIAAGSDTPRVEIRCGDEDGGLEATLKNADIVINTSGKSRTSSTQTRADLAKDNLIVSAMLADVLKRVFPEESRKPTVIQLTNPVDLMMRALLKDLEGSHFPTDRVIGLGGELDKLRLVQSITRTLGLPKDAIRGASVVGTHDESMVPVFSGIEVKKAGTWHPISEYATVKQLEDIRRDTEKGGGRFPELTSEYDRDGNLVKKGKSDDGGPAAAVEVIIRRILEARKGQSAEPVNCSVYSPEHDCCIGVPIRIRQDGGYDIMPMKLAEGEKVLFNQAVNRAQKSESTVLGVSGKGPRVSSGR